MAKVSVDIPEEMKEKIDSLSSEKMYKSSSEYIRDALRKKIREDTALNSEEKQIVEERLRKEEKGESDYYTLDEAREELGLTDESGTSGRSS